MRDRDIYYWHPYDDLYVRTDLVADLIATWRGSWRELAYAAGIGTRQLRRIRSRRYAYTQLNVAEGILMYYGVAEYDVYRSPPGIRGNFVLV